MVGKNYRAISPDTSGKPQTPAEGLVAQIGVPARIFGNRALIAWLASLRIYLRIQQVKYLKMHLGIPNRRSGDNPKAYFYERQDIEKIVERICRVPASAWLEARSKDDGDIPPHVMFARLHRKSAIQFKSRVDHRMTGDPNFIAYAMVETVDPNRDSSGHTYRVYERVALDTSKKRAKLNWLMVSHSRDRVERWDPSSLALLPGVTARPRIIQYTSVARATTPSMGKEPKYSVFACRGIWYATTLLVAYHIHPESGKLVRCQVSAKLLGYDCDGDISAVVSACSPFKHILATEVITRYPDAFWMAWTGGREVLPVTLEPAGPRPPKDGRKIEEGISVPNTIQFRDED